MSDKSHVTMERYRCLACDVEFDTGALLLDKRLRKVFERYTTTGNGLCPEHAKEGYITLIGATCATRGNRDMVNSSDEVYRTGDIAMVRSERWSTLFNSPLPPRGIAFVDPKVIEVLKMIPVEEP